MSDLGLMATSASCRVDVWLWRARFVKTRSLAAALVERGAVRLTHQGRQVRLDKPSRCVHPGDSLVFSLNERITAVRIEALGERRGPPSEARALYSPLDVVDPG
ncbi:RNA-binding S4 domain-containing protein [Brevundimonas variabilis]|uniref:Ribosome-associated heat shock protein Hsp15 n=1 Tax=Brevundimonas variabilis TaxID=74312 RepID=A0A7W9CG40_9CAUL|nr:RNA-binding S4 domain-containing protein [Brevundimonas variabilis]MBB5744990.1 ribosome-associated heat shock protein Hsp15 [Brevundimonas variabilis]